MKNLFLFATFLFFTSISFANDFCRYQRNFNYKGLLKSGDEALRSDTVDVLNYDCYLDYTQMTSNLIFGICEVKFEAKMDINSISLDLLQLNIDSITYNGNQIPFSYDDTLIVAHFPSTISTGQQDSVTVFYNGTPQTDPSGWGGFYFSGAYVYNLGVGFESDPHNYGRVWHPCFDNFVERGTYTFNILTNNQNTAYCNGIRTNVQPVGTDSLLTTWIMNDAIPSYLAGVSISTYTHVELNYYSALQGINIPIWLVAHEADTTNFKNSFVNLNAAIEAYETKYGPYIWDRVGYVTVPFNAGAMEHATHIAYPLVVVNGTTAYQSLMAHELSHHWWGDWVTTETAEEMWINEGMAVYSEHLFEEWMNGYTGYIDVYRDNHFDCLHRAHIDDSGHYALNAVPIKWTYGTHSYYKAADFIHTLRSYLGDTDFFTGLQYIQNNYGGGNINSVEFMNALNTSTSSDVTDYFNDWIFQPGWSNFTVVSFNTTPNGGNFDVQIIIDQTLKGAANYYSNVPFEITFMDAAWNKHTEMVLLGGDYQALNLTIPINPVFVALNLDEKISHATTAIVDTVTSTGNKFYDYANVRFTCTSLTDSVMLRVEHNWVRPEVYNVPPNIQISKDRYWNIHGVDLTNAQGELRFEYDGRNGANWDFDNSIMVNVGGQTFKEDSLVLLYRPNATSDWQIHPNYDLNFLGSHTDKHGYLTALSFAAGQYAFGYRVHSVDIEKEDNEQTYSIYPNPAVDSVVIDLKNFQKGHYSVEFYAINGQYVKAHILKGEQTNSIPVSNLDNGIYILVLKHDGEIFGTKRVVIGK